MKKVFVFLVTALLCCGLYLLIPLGLFGCALYSFDVSQDILLHELNGISPLLMTEKRPEESEEPEASVEFITFSISEEALGEMLFDILKKKQHPLLAVDHIEIQISPEMVSLAISWAYHLLDYQFYQATIFSEWVVRSNAGNSDDENTAMIEIKPYNIHSNKLYSVNWADVWQLVNRIKNTDEWFTLFSKKQELPIRDILLQDDQLSINVNI